MENQSDARILNSVRRLNEILSPSGNRVLLLDFSHFLAVSGEHDNIIVKTCGQPQCAAEYEAALEKAYTAEGFVKYKVDEQEREQFFVYDFLECAPFKPPHDYKFGPERNLNKLQATVRADTEDALKWFDAVKASGLCSSGVVLARGTSSMQSNIYLFLAKKLGIESPSAVQLDRHGKAKRGDVVAEETSALLANIFNELNELLRDEMEETAARLLRQYYSNVSFISHERRNAEVNISQASRLETAKSLGIGLCIALSVGVNLGSKQDPSEDEVRIEHVNNFLNAYSELMKEDDEDASLRWSFPKSLQKLERWQACVIMEITRNAQRDVDGETPHRVNWEVAADGQGGLRMCCVSSPHVIDPSVWPWQGVVNPDSMKGTHFIARLAKAEDYEATWSPQPLEEDPGRWEVRFELARRESSR